MKSWAIKISIFAIATIIGCAKPHIPVSDLKEFELCRRWNERLGHSVYEIEGVLELRSDRIEGRWDAYVVVESFDNVKVILFDPFSNLEVGRIEPKGKRMIFKYGRYRFNLDIPSDVFAQALTASPNCDMIRKHGKLRYSLKFKDDQLLLWTVWRKSRIIGVFKYSEGFGMHKNRVIPKKLEFVWEGEPSFKGAFVFYN